LIVGDGSEYESLLELTIACDAGSYVNFLGALQYRDVSSLMDNCDAFFHFSLWDGIPNSVLEALSHSLPVFAYDSPKSSVSDLKQFYAPIFYFDSFSTPELFESFQSFLSQCVFSSGFVERSTRFRAHYAASASLDRFISSQFS
jgi:glycosyltransferase involved in cell wall biosynthesis